MDSGAPCSLVHGSQLNWPGWRMSFKPASVRHIKISSRLPAGARHASSCETMLSETALNKRLHGLSREPPALKRIDVGHV